MNLNQYAILFEVIGFFLSSFTLFILKIGWVGRFIARIRQQIKTISEIPNKKNNKDIREIYGLLALLAVIALGLLELSPIWKQKKLIKQRTHILNLVIGVLSIPILFIFVILIRLAEVIDRMTVFLSTIIRGLTAYTIIFIGLLFVFAGLILQLIATFQ